MTNADQRRQQRRQAARAARRAANGDKYADKAPGPQDPPTTLSAALAALSEHYAPEWRHDDKDTAR